MTARELFVSDPVAFMRDNIVRCQFFDGGFRISESRPAVLTIKEMRGSPKIVNRPGGNVYYLSDQVDGCSRAEKALVYFVGYKDNDTVSGTLNKNSRMAFTANMDGCTLGVGSQGGDGACYVTHANNKAAGKAGGAANQAAAQHEQLAEVYGGGDFWSIRPSSYMDAMGSVHQFKGTNFGVNIDDWWFFYTHRWMQMSSSRLGSYIHGGCDEANFLG